MRRAVGLQRSLSQNAAAKQLPTATARLSRAGITEHTPHSGVFRACQLVAGVQDGRDDTVCWSTQVKLSGFRHLSRAAPADGDIALREEGTALRPAFELAAMHAMAARI